MNKPNPSHQKYYQGMYNLECLNNKELERDNDRLFKENLKLRIAVGALVLTLALVMLLG